MMNGPQITEEALARADIIDVFEAFIDTLPPAQLKTVHRFAPHMYIREIEVPAGTIFTGMAHSTEHPYVLSKGTVDIFVIGEGVSRYEAPITGITTVGTRRLAYAVTDIVWTTFHVTDETDIVKLEEMLDAHHENPLLPNGARHTKYIRGHVEHVPSEKELA